MFYGTFTDGLTISALPLSESAFNSLITKPYVLL